MRVRGRGSSAPHDAGTEGTHPQGVEVTGICAIVARMRHEKLIEEMITAAEAGADLIELRLDLLGHEPRFKDILAQRPDKVPLIATFRRKQDGGRFAHDEAKRMLLVRAAIVDGFDYIDLEHDIAAQVPRFGRTKRIVSFHDMKGFPKNLPQILTDMEKLDADIIKVAVRGDSVLDHFRLIRMMAGIARPKIGIVMGEAGQPSRILAGRFGAPFTYAAFNPERIVAPGLLTMKELRELYHAHRIGPETGIYGVIGDPIAQSLSPLVHNDCFRFTGQDKAYVPYHVRAEELEEFLRGFARTGGAGLSVTIPHKQAILNFGTAAEELVGRSGSANTMLCEDSGEKPWKLYNTDGPAAIAAIRSVFGDGPLTGRSVLILGVGGVSRTLAFALAAEGAIVTVTGRRPEAANALASEVGCKVIDWSGRNSARFEILVNGTPIGMVPKTEAIPLHPKAIQPGSVVFDTIYNPERTMLIKEAEELGAKTVGGLLMFVRQAEAQFRLFTRQDPPTGRMEELVREELSPGKNMLREARLARERGEA